MTSRRRSPKGYAKPKKRYAGPKPTKQFAKPKKQYATTSRKKSTYPTLEELRQRGAVEVPGGGGAHYVLCEGKVTHWKVLKDDGDVFDSVKCWCKPSTTTAPDNNE